MRTWIETGNANQSQSGGSASSTGTTRPKKTRRKKHQPTHYPQNYDNSHHYRSRHFDEEEVIAVVRREGPNSLHPPPPTSALSSVFGTDKHKSISRSNDGQGFLDQDEYYWTPYRRNSRLIKFIIGSIAAILFIMILAITVGGGGGSDDKTNNSGVDLQNSKNHPTLGNSNSGNPNRDPDNKHPGFNDVGLGNGDDGNGGNAGGSSQGNDNGYSSPYKPNVPDTAPLKPADEDLGDSASSKPATTHGPIVIKPEVPEFESNREEFATELVRLYDLLGLDLAALMHAAAQSPTTRPSKDDSPVQLALQWIAGSSEYQQMTITQKIQRYALAVFYYSTFMRPNAFWPTPTDWTSQNQWLSATNECGWEGVICNDQSKVSAIMLADHALSGSLPFELGLLGDLDSLDLSSNFIYQADEDLNVFLYLTGLKHLWLDDNFIFTDSGLPTQFASLVNLERVQLSYNLLQGNLAEDGSWLLNLKKLTHLEVESNYLAGPIPDELGQLSSLTYFYARRNWLQVSLSNLLDNGKYRNLFSLWLDGNNVVGTIPSTIGLLTDLASFSITNTTLHGPIPTEMGLCTQLKRIWLYENELTGTIPTEFNQLTNLQVLELFDNQLEYGQVVPEGVCEAIAMSDYSYKSLALDCTRVACDHCCTACVTPSN